MCGILGLLARLADHHSVRSDWSAYGSATLGDELLATLNRLEASEQPVLITGFSVQARDTRSADQDRQLRDFLRVLDDHSTAIETRFVNFDRDPLQAKRLDVTTYGTVVVQVGENRVDLRGNTLFRRVGSGAEARVIWQGETPWNRAFSQALQPEPVVIYALRGHGESLPFERGLGELRGLGEMISGLGWTQRALNLLGDGAPTVPNDAAAVLILGPEHPMTPGEQQGLQDYLVRGGAVGIWLEEPSQFPTFMSGMGISMDGGIAMDPASLHPWEDRPLLHPRHHPMTQGLLGESAPVIAIHASALNARPVSGVQADVVLSTSSRGWAERGAFGPAVFEPTVDDAGPVAVSLALRIGSSGRLWVTGDLDVIGDELLSNGPGNRAFGLAGLRWLVKGEAHTTAVRVSAAVSR
ncbi:MAG: hypothetical protein GWP91_00310 [Rhodobacterales bacterium]|nr:hypothetical protein [Rhodobacterales bacterium]